MRRLILTRRRFGALLGAALAAPAPPAWALDGARPARIEISAFDFSAPDLILRKGDTVEWVNHDLAPHTATDDAGRWDTGRLDKGQSAVLTFKTPGEYRYHCAFHPHMRGRIVVVG